MCVCVFWDGFRSIWFGSDLVFLLSPPPHAVQPLCAHRGLGFVGAMYRVQGGGVRPYEPIYCRPWVAVLCFLLAWQNVRRFRDFWFPGASHPLSACCSILIAGLEVTRYDRTMVNPGGRVGRSDFVCLPVLTFVFLYQQVRGVHEKERVEGLGLDGRRNRQVGKIRPKERVL